MGRVFAGDAAWKPVNIGAGGWLTGMDIARDGTMVARTDTYGAYIWNGKSWTQLVTAGSMPDSVVFTGGVYEIRIAASNTNIFYMTLNDGIYKTVDRGQTWTKTNFPNITFDGNNSNRMDGQKLAIDPKNPNIVFAGTQKDGLWVTRDGGANWQKINAVPQGSNTKDPGLTGIVIQGSNVFVGTAGSGVYTSNDGGLTWKAIGGPADISHAVIAPDGSYYASGNTDTALWKFSNGVWTKPIEKDVHSIAINPFNPGHIVVAQAGGALRESFDHGKTWGGWNWGNRLESSADVPWLENSGKYMSTGAIMFDPLVAGKLWHSAGVGMWETSLPKNFGWSTPIVWNSQSKGIEQLVANEILAPAGGNPVFSSWDRPFFEMNNLDVAEASYGGGDFSMGWSIDYASSNPSFMVGISDWWGKENSGFSTDGGNTWQKFAGLPTWANTTIGGSIAASTTKNFIWVATGNQPPAYTLDGGQTWTNISIPGVSDWSALHNFFYLSRTTITADRVLPNTFYLQDPKTGVYRTTDGGVSWTKVFNGQPAGWSFWNAKIEAVPGKAGELFFTSGPQGTDSSPKPLLPLMHSKDGGATWQPVAGVEAARFGFGAAKTPDGPATIYIVGNVKGDSGIFYSSDGAKSWTKIGERPMGSLDSIKTISGDMDQFGLVYIGFSGSGYAYLDFAGAAPVEAPLAAAPVARPAPVAPTQLATISQALDDVGGTSVVTNGATINDKTPTLSGTLSTVLQPGQSLAVLRDGVIIGRIDPTSTAWSFTDTGANDGRYNYAVRVIDGQGQLGQLSSTFNLTIDTVAPTQKVIVTSVSGPASTMLAVVGKASGAQVSGTITGALGAGETLVVFRNDVRVGTATVDNGKWTFVDSVNAGSFRYTAQVQDAAGNLGQLSAAQTAQIASAEPNRIFGTILGDNLQGTAGTDIISGVQATGTRLGWAHRDVLTGNAGNDTFVLGDARGRFYDDGNRTSVGIWDYARITDFSAGDKIQLKGTAAEYFQNWVSNVHGFSGTGIYHDTNRNGVLDSRDELIALVQNQPTLDPGSFIYV